MLSFLLKKMDYLYSFYSKYLKLILLECGWSSRACNTPGSQMYSIVADWCSTFHNRLVAWILGNEEGYTKPDSKKER